MQDSRLDLSSPEVHRALDRRLSGHLPGAGRHHPAESPGEEDAPSSAGLPTGRCHGGEARVPAPMPPPPHVLKGHPPPTFHSSLPETTLPMLPLPPTTVLTTPHPAVVSTVCPSIQGSGGHEVQPWGPVREKMPG